MITLQEKAKQLQHFLELIFDEEVFNIIYKEPEYLRIVFVNTNISVDNFKKIQDFATSLNLSVAICFKSSSLMLINKEV